MSNGQDRLQRLLAADQQAVTGIDYVYVHENQTTLDVFFHKPPDAITPSLIDDDDGLEWASIRILGASGDVPEIPVSEGFEWLDTDGGPRFLRLTTEHPGSFSLYRLFIDDSRIDPYFNGVTFSFKAVCESDLDCRPGPHRCPPEEAVDFPVDYQSRDFWSLRQALLDFASQRYPDWKDRLEADAGVMLAEVMSALGDELAYYQDRIGREAYLETATQRRSVRHHTRLVDYEIHEGLAGSTWLDVSVDHGELELPAGTDAWAESGGDERIDYEVGRGLFDRDASGDPAVYEVSASGNSLDPHLWDEDDTCLPAGATTLDIRGEHPTLFPTDPTFGGRWVLLKTHPDSADQPARRWLVQVVRLELLDDPLTEERVTRLQWEEAQALPFELDLTMLEVRANLVPATAGRTHRGYFLIGADPGDPLLEIPKAVQPLVIRAVERQGRLVEGRTPADCTVYLYTLPDSDKYPLCWQGERPEEATPETELRVVTGWDGEEPQFAEADPWEWRRSLLGTFASQPGDAHFTLEDGNWRRVVGYQRTGQEIVHRDYARVAGKTIRFGDGEFGQVPRRGTLFEATYRLGNGRNGNLAADSLTRFDPGTMPGAVIGVTNPLPATNGIEAEPLAEVRQLAPEAFRAITYRAVRPEDYGEAAERLPWVQRANGLFRWTGSWVSAFVTADPRGATTVTAEQHIELTEQIERFRQAGREAHVDEPRYADLDLEITICAESFAYRGEVEERVLAVLLGKSGRNGFFSPDNFTFGTPLRRSRLEAAIQNVAGVKAVEAIQYRRRGVFDWRPLAGPHYPVGDREVIRVDNDPNHPGHGSVKLEMRGGA